METIQSYLNLLLEQRCDELAFVVLFGSRARGDWLPDSDYDVFIGLSMDDGKRFIDRMADFSPQEAVNLDIFPYSRSEWQHMFDMDHPLLLEALEEGQVLWDQGAFAEMRTQFQVWRREGRLQPWHSGWRITEPTQ